MPWIFQASVIQVTVLKGISHFWYCEEFSLLFSTYICKNKSLVGPYIYNCSCMQDRPASAKCGLFVSINVIRNTCNRLACSKSVIQRSYHIYLADSLYHMEAITFGSRCILREIKTGMIPSLRGGGRKNCETYRRASFLAHRLAGHAWSSASHVGVSGLPS